MAYRTIEISRHERVKVSDNGNLVALRIADEAVLLTADHARELAEVLRAFATVVDSQETPILD